MAQRAETNGKARSALPGSGGRVSQIGSLGLIASTKRYGGSDWDAGSAGHAPGVHQDSTSECRPSKGQSLCQSWWPGCF